MKYSVMQDNVLPVVNFVTCGPNCEWMNDTPGTTMAGRVRERSSGILLFDFAS
jgi:hypothetical protein